MFIAVATTDADGDGPKAFAFLLFLLAFLTLTVFAVVFTVGVVIWLRARWSASRDIGTAPVVP